MKESTRGIEPNESRGERSGKKRIFLELEENNEAGEAMEEHNNSNVPFAPMWLWENGI